MTEKFIHKKSLGQNFLNSAVVPGWMCDAGAVGAGDLVLEIGPGTGALTRELLVRGARVVAVEADARAIEALQQEFSTEIASGALRVEQGDMRKLSAETVAQIFDLRDREYKLVANIPYYLSGLLFRTFLETTCQPSEIVFLVQKEVAERIARSKKESLLSLSVKAFGEPTYIKTVSKGHFTPSPKVDSAIISIKNISRKHFTDLDSHFFFELLHLGFGQKRKQLAVNLAKKYAKQEVVNILSTGDLSETVRAEDVSLNHWLKIAKTLIV